MQTDIRPENMQRITTPELAKAFIEEQVSEIRATVKDKKVLWRCRAGWTLRSSPRFLSRQ